MRLRSMQQIMRAKDANGDCLRTGSIASAPRHARHLRRQLPEEVGEASIDDLAHRL
jgi:hypothetical protein